MNINQTDFYIFIAVWTKECEFISWDFAKEADIWKPNIGFRGLSSKAFNHPPASAAKEDYEKRENLGYLKKKKLNEVNSQL